MIVEGVGYDGALLVKRSPVVCGLRRASAGMLEGFPEGGWMSLGENKTMNVVLLCLSLQGGDTISLHFVLCPQQGGWIKPMEFQEFVMLVHFISDGF